MAQMWPPKKNTAFDLYFGIRDADGDLVTGATTPDSEVSLDGAAFNDCTNEATEIGTTGIYKLALTAGEMNADVVIVQTKTATAGAKTFVIVLYTTESTWNEGVDCKAALTGAITSGSFAAGAIDAAAIADNAIDAGALAADAITAAKIATGAIDADALAADAITAAKVAADVSAEIADAVWDEDATGHQTTGTFGQAIGDPVADTDTIWGLVNTNLDATVSSRATQTSVNTIDDFVDTEVSAIKAVTDLLPNAGALTTIQSDLDDIQSRLPAALSGGRMNSDIQAINNNTSPVSRFERSARAIVKGTVGSSSTQTSIVTSSLDPAAAVTDQFKGRIVIFDETTTTTNLRGQATDITASTAGGVLTVTLLTTAPVSGDTFVIV